MALSVVFGVCLLCWATRFARDPDLHFPVFIEYLAEQEWSVWLEHFAAALGVPSLAAAAGFHAASRPPKRRRANQPLADWLVIFFCASVGMLGYCIGEFGHEAMQLTLGKKSNYGQYLADHCIPASTIQQFGACSKTYFGVLESQLMADACGLLAFLVLFLILAYQAGRARINIF
ncbi:hypothetical protein CDN99_15710 [Roseateles aquatilis]|uniref:Uncharacterized protein n=1 Tax=Roseateles aquatilis TaxID=431061 RepID=A0A246J8F0_9BURK|nr:hypothetical protein CDN99_15710 [Roseateles aquatilis]